MNARQPAVLVETTPGPTGDLYAQEMQARLSEWHSKELEPPFTGTQFVPLVLLTLVLPAIGLVVGWAL